VEPAKLVAGDGGTMTAQWQRDGAVQQFEADHGRAVTQAGLDRFR
jgi:hypothetical protein